MKVRTTYLIVLLLLTTLLLAACGAAAPTAEPTVEPPATNDEGIPTEAVEETQEPPLEEGEQIPASEETPTEGEAAPRGLPGAPDAITQTTIEHLSAVAGLPQEEIEVVSVEPREWPSSALGCPQPDQAYLEVITPGYEVVLEANGEQFSLHTDESGSSIVLCQDGAESEEGDDIVEGAMAPDASGEETGLESAVLDTVAEQSGIAREELTIVSQEAVQWSDSALGCPQPGMMYLQVITPGYRFVVEGDGETFNVHTDESGSSVILCDQEV